MNINNVIKALRQSRKLQPISVYCPQAQPSVPANREFFDEITPILKLLLKAFKQAGFSDCLSKWGELTLFNSTMGIEILIRMEPNTSYMSKVSLAAIKKNGYEVLEIHSPSKPLVLNYFFYGTKSKWRQIPFDLEFSSVESVYIEFIQPMLQASKPFQGRLKTSLQLEKNKHFATKETILAFARYASNNIASVHGLAQLNQIFVSKYVRECFFSDYGAVLFTDYWHGIQIITWHKNDRTFLEKHIPEIFEPYRITSESIARVSEENEDHQFLLEALDKALLINLKDVGEVELWLNDKQYFTDEKVPIRLLDTLEGTFKVLSTVVR